MKELDSKSQLLTCHNRKRAKGWQMCGMVTSFKTLESKVWDKIRMVALEVTIFKLVCQWTWYLTILLSPSSVHHSFRSSCSPTLTITMRITLWMVIKEGKTENGSCLQECNWSEWVRCKGTEGSKNGWKEIWGKRICGVCRRDHSDAALYFIFFFFPYFYSPFFGPFNHSCSFIILLFSPSYSFISHVRFSLSPSWLLFLLKRAFLRSLCRKTGKCWRQTYFLPFLPLFLSLIISLHPDLASLSSLHLYSFLPLVLHFDCQVGIVCIQWSESVSWGFQVHLTREWVSVYRNFGRKTERMRQWERRERK